MVASGFARDFVCLSRARVVSMQVRAGNMLFKKEQNPYGGVSLQKGVGDPS